MSPLAIHGTCGFARQAPAGNLQLQRSSRRSTANPELHCKAGLLPLLSTSTSCRVSGNLSLRKQGLSGEKRIVQLRKASFIGIPRRCSSPCSSSSRVTTQNPSLVQGSSPVCAVEEASSSSGVALEDNEPRNICVSDVAPKASSSSGVELEDNEPRNICVSHVAPKRIRPDFLNRPWTSKDISFASYMVFMHSLFLAAPFMFSWGDSGAIGVLYVITGCLGITLSYHRNLSHKSFKIPKWLEYGFAYSEVQAVQVSGIFLKGWKSDVSLDVDDEPDVNEERSKSGSLASTPESTHDVFNGERIETVHTAVADGDSEELQNFLATSSIDASTLESTHDVLNGERIESVHTAVADGDTEELQNFLATSSIYASSPESTHDVLNGERVETVHTAVADGDTEELQNYLATSSLDASTPESTHDVLNGERIESVHTAVADGDTEGSQDFLATSSIDASIPESTHDVLNGERIETVHTAVADGDTEELQNFLTTSSTDASVPAEVSRKLDSSPYALSTSSTLEIPEVKVNGTSSSLKSELEEISTTEEASNIRNEVIPNGALNGSSKARSGANEPKLAGRASVLIDKVEENFVEAGEEGRAALLVDENYTTEKEHGVETNDRVQPPSDLVRLSIVEKRAELAKIIGAVSQRSVEGYLGKINGQKLSTPLLDSPETSPSRNIPLTKLEKGKIKASTRSSAKRTPSLVDILPVVESSGAELYLKAYEKFLRAGRVQDCVVLLEEMDKVKILNSDKIYHSSFFKACQKQNAVREAFRFMRLLSRPTLSSYNMLLCVCREARDVDGGLRVLSAVEKAGFKPDTILYTTLISTCAKAGKVDIAFKVFHDMQTAGVKASIETYGAMIDGCTRAGQIAKAFGVYGIMISKNVKPDHVIFNTLINACGRAGAIERAFDVLADMKAEPSFLTPNHVTIGALITACARAGQVDRAFEVYRNMRKWGIKGTPECYTAAVHACSPTGDLNLALSVFEDIKRDGVKPDEIFFSALIDVAGHSKQVDAAFSILDDMKKVAVIPGATTYSALMGVCCNAGHWERGLELYKKVRAYKFLPTVSTFNALITVLCDAKQIEQSFSVFQEMKEAGVQADQITYSILLDACEKLDEPDRAYDLYTSGRAEGIIPNEAMCASVIAICYARIKKKHSSPNYRYSIGLLAGQTNEAPYEQWASWAVAVYRHAVAANVVPTIKSLSLLLGCLRIPEAQLEKNILFDDTFSHAGNSRLRPPSILDGAGFYDPRALALFEEAATMGVVPHLNYKAGPITVNAESMPSYVAEVYLVTLLKGLKQRHSDGAQLFPVTIFYLTETKQTLLATKDLVELKVSGRTGQAVASLLRRLRLHFHGHESSGRLRIDTASIRKWLKPAVAFPSLPRHQELGPLGPAHTFLAQRIAEQQRAIRMGEVFKNSADIERLSSDDSALNMYRNRRNQWDHGKGNDFDFPDRINGWRQGASRKRSADKRRP